MTYSITIYGFLARFWLQAIIDMATIDKIY